MFEPLSTHEKPRAPRYVQALFEKDGQFKTSDKCWDQRGRAASQERRRVRGLRSMNFLRSQFNPKKTFTQLQSDRRLFGWLIFWALVIPQMM